MQELYYFLILQIAQKLITGILPCFDGENSLPMDAQLHHHLLLSQPGGLSEFL